MFTPLKLKIDIAPTVVKTKFLSTSQTLIRQQKYRSPRYTIDRNKLLIIE